MSTHLSPVPPSLRELETERGFAERHIGPDADEQAKMLAVVGYGSLAELIEQAVPASIRDDPGGSRRSCPLPPRSKCLPNYAHSPIRTSCSSR